MTDERINAANRINAVLDTLDRPDTVIVLQALMEQHRVFYEPPHILKGRHAVKIAAAALGLLLLAVAPAWAQTGPTVKQSACTFSWTAPQTNADGTNLADLKEYGIYAGVTPTALTTIVATVPAPTADPAAGATASWSCKSLAPGQWFIQVDAADTAGNRSARTTVVPFVSQDDVPPSAPSAPQVGP